jgi:hypothetical protein
VVAITEGHEGSERRARADSPVPRYSIPPPSAAISQYAANEHSRTYSQQHFRRNGNLEVTQVHQIIRSTKVLANWIRSGPGQALVAESIWRGPASLIARAGSHLLSRTLAAM